MKIKCLHGYFIFREEKAGEAGQFISLFGLTLEAKEDFFTFPKLAAAPEYSINGSTYLGAPATKTFSGRPWEVMRENNLVYNFVTGEVVNISTVIQRFEISTAGTVFASSGLILPGSINQDGAKVRDFSAWWSRDTMRFRYSEVSYD